MPDIVTPQIVELSNQFRAQLLARERRAATAMVRYYGTVWGELQSEITALQVETAAMAAAGEAITADRLWRLERMRAIQAQAGEELLRFSQYASDAIAAAKREAIAAAERNAHNLVLAAFPVDAGIEISFATMPREAVEALAGFLVDGSPLRELLEQAVGEAAESFAQTMVTGIAAGWNPRKLTRELRSKFGMGLTQSLTIARTEQLRAYRTATLASYRRSGVVVEWERHAAHNTRTCMACVLLDGRRYSLAEEMDDHPNGRCALLPITATYAEMGIDAPEPDFKREMGHDWFLRQAEADQRDMMGQGMWQAWKDGKFDLDAIPKLVTNDVWGNAWVPRSLKDLTNAP